MRQPLNRQNINKSNTSSAQIIPSTQRCTSLINETQCNIVIVLAMCICSCRNETFYVTRNIIHKLYTIRESIVRTHRIPRKCSTYLYNCQYFNRVQQQAFMSPLALSHKQHPNIALSVLSVVNIALSVLSVGSLFPTVLQLTQYNVRTLPTLHISNNRGPVVYYQSTSCL